MVVFVIDLSFNEQTENFLNLASSGYVFKFKTTLEKIDPSHDEVGQKDISLTKTLLSAIGGKSFYRILMWTGGASFHPVSSCIIKKEPKKFRKLINADMVAFVKQTLLYDWILVGADPETKNAFYYFLDAKDRVERLERISTVSRNEKWSCPVDLKDFHVQFGKRHHSMFLRCLRRRTHTIQDKVCREEIEYVIDELENDMTKGTAEFNVSLDGKDNDFSRAIQRRGIWDYIHSKQIEYTSQYNEMRGKTNSMFKFAISNGILSGWKLTSLLGSSYNMMVTTLLSSLGLPIFQNFPSDLVVQGDDTHFKTRYLMHSLYHFSMVNSIGKVAHTKKQFISSRYTEFLKAIYDMKERRNHYIPARMITSLCYEKENTPVSKDRKAWPKDIVDNWNLFLVRIPDDARRNYIINRGYPRSAFKSRFKLSGVNVDFLEQYFSNPPRLSQYLLGPLTRLEDIVEEDGTIKQGRQWMRCVVKEFPRVFQKRHESNSSSWVGITDLSKMLSNEITRQINQAEENQITINCDVDTLSDYFVGKLSEMVDEYKLPQGELVEFHFSKLLIKEREKYQKILSQQSVIEELIYFYLDAYLNDFNIMTPFSALIIISDDLTRFIYSKLKQTLEDLDDKVADRKIFEAMKVVSGSARGFTVEQYDILTQRMDSKLLFKFFNCATYGPSTTRYLYNDEYLGLVSHILTAAFPIILYIMFGKNFLNVSVEEQQGAYSDLMMVFIEIWVRKNWHVVDNKIRSWYRMKISRKERDQYIVG